MCFGACVCAQWKRVTTTRRSRYAEASRKAEAAACCCQKEDHAARETRGEPENRQTEAVTISDTPCNDAWDANAIGIAVTIAKSARDDAWDANAFSLTITESRARNDTRHADADAFPRAITRSDAAPDGPDGPAR